MRTDRQTVIITVGAVFICISSLILMTYFFIIGENIIAIILLVDLLLAIAFTVLWIRSKHAYKKLSEMTAAGGIEELLASAEWDACPSAKKLNDAISNAAYKTRLETLKDQSFTQLRLSVLQGQLNPHFLYNTLDCIRSDALIAGNREVATMLEVLGSFCRYNNGRQSTVTLFDEIENVKCYMKIQNYRFSGRYQLEINYKTEEKNILRAKVPRLILQPVVENAIVHGLEHRRSGIIRLSIDASEQLLMISISDNGSGMDEATLKQLNYKLSNNIIPKEGHGIAVSNVNQQIQLLFGKQYGLHVYSQPEIGTDVEFTLPLEELEQT